MSRTVSVKATYLNGQTASFGWYCPKNSDMVENSFDYYQYLNIEKLINKEIKGKRIKNDQVEVTVNCSDSKGEYFFYKDVTHIKKAFEPSVYNKIIHALNFK